MDQQLLAFITVVDKKSFTRAAESLHLTQSAVTSAVKSLENKLNTKLLDRTNKFIRLTKSGEIVYYHGKEIINDYKRIERLIYELHHSASGILKIGASFTFGEYILPKLLGEFTKQYPNIHPEISIRNSRRVMNQLLKDELDLAIIEGNLDRPQLPLHAFAEEEMTIILPPNHPLANREEVSLEELSNEVWIIREEGSGTREANDRLFRDHSFTPKMTRTFGSPQIIKESVEAGLGIALLSKSVIRKELQTNTIKPIRIKGYPIIRSFYYATRNTEFQPKTTELFLQFLTQGGGTGPTKSNN